MELHQQKQNRIVYTYSVLVTVCSKSQNNLRLNTNMPKSRKNTKKGANRPVIYSYDVDGRTCYVGKAKILKKRNNQHKAGSLHIDRILRRQSTWPEPTTLESIDPTREEEYVNNRERHHIKVHNTYFRGYNKTPGGNMGHSRPGGQLWENLDFFKKLKNLPMPGNQMTVTQKKLLQQLVMVRPLPPIFRVTVDLTRGSTSEEYEQERSERICQMAWDKYRYHFADQRADLIQLGSFVYRNRLFV